MSGGRAHWPIRRYRLGDEPSDDPSQLTSAEERLAVMWHLAYEGLRLSGRPMPTYARHEAPVRVFRRGERPPDE